MRMWVYMGEAINPWIVTEIRAMNRNTADVVRQHEDDAMCSQELAIERIREKVAQNGISITVNAELHEMQDITGKPIYKGWFWSREITCPDCNEELEICLRHHWGDVHRFALCECGFIWGGISLW